MESTKPTQQEHWLRGPVAGVPALLQPVAHGLLQANDEIANALRDFDEAQLWKKPHGVASVGFHLQHIPGVLDRMLTYAKGSALSSDQLKYLSEEGIERAGVRLPDLLAKLDAQIHSFIDSIKNIDVSTLTEVRTVGRKRLPSTVIGLLSHATEHTMRHTGQLLVTVRVMDEK